MRSFRSFTVLLLVATGFGCLEPLGPNDVDFTYATHYVQKNQIEVVNEKTAGSLVALVPDGGVWEERALEHRGVDGRFAIREVPEGRYFLRKGNADAGDILEYYDTDARVAKFEPRTLGAPSDGLGEGAELRISASNAAWYQGSGTFCLTSISAGLGGVCSGWVQDTSASGFSVSLDFDSEIAPYYPNADLLRRGDDVVVHQLDYTVVDDGVLWSYGATARGRAITDLDMAASNGVASVTGDLTEVDQDQIMGFSVDRGSFLYASTLSHPAADPWGIDVSIELAMNTKEGLMFADGAAPWVAFAVLYPGDTDSGMLTFPYANPFSAPWTPVRRALAYSRLQLQLTNGSGGQANPLNRYLYFSVEEAKESAVGGMEAYLEPPMNVRVDGKVAMDSAVISKAPLLEWDADLSGRTTSYRIYAYEMYVDSANNTRSRLLGRFHTRATSLQLPPLFKPGSKASFVLYGYHGEVDAPDAIVTHSSSPVPGASASTSTSILTVSTL